MKPDRIRLANFMSYAAVEIDFSQSDLLAIVGPTGAGKSTILQGITYALWGKVRTASHNDVVRRGTSGCAVQFDFIAANGVKHRVVRRRNLSGKGSSELELSWASPTGWKPLTKPTIAETQAKIDEIVGCGYDVFSNSSLLQQGEASMFSDAPPSKRKELLGELLNLGELIKIETLARAKLKELARETGGIDAAIDNIEVELGGIEEIDTEELEVKRGALDDEIEQIKKHIDAANEGLREVNALVEKLGDEEDKLDLIGRRVQELTVDLKQAEVIAGKFHELTDRAEEIRSAKLKSHTLRKRHDELLELMEIQHERDTLTELEDEDIEIDEELSRLAEERADLDDRTKKMEDYLATAHDHLNYLELQLAEERTKRHALSGYWTRIKDDGICPVCEMEVWNVEGVCIRIVRHIDQAQLAVEKLKDEREGQRRKIEDATGRSAELAKEKDLLDKEEYRALNRQEITVAGIENLKAWLREHDSGEDFHQEELDLVEDQIRELGDVDKEFEILVFAESQVGDADEKVGTLDARHELACIESSKQRAIVKELEMQLDGMYDPSVYMSDLGTLGEELEVRGHLLIEVLDAIAEAKVNVKRKKHLEDRYLELTEGSENLWADHKIMELLVQASSKTGAQALIIEAALPQLERDANKFMEIMSPTMSIALESQRVTGTGNVRETLDINVISDGQIAPIETLSGGERFRADLALRLAIGSLLARRSGATIDMLAIDEGFGSQDADGQENILSIIDSLKSKFGCIMVITHVSQVAENIENRMVVSKIGNRSVVQRV